MSAIDDFTTESQPGAGGASAPHETFKGLLRGARNEAPVAPEPQATDDADDAESVSEEIESPEPEDAELETSEEDAGESASPKKKSPVAFYAVAVLFLGFVGYMAASNLGLLGARPAAQQGSLQPPVLAPVPAAPMAAVPAENTPALDSPVVAAPPALVPDTAAPVTEALLPNPVARVAVGAVPAAPAALTNEARLERELEAARSEIERLSDQTVVLRTQLAAKPVPAEKSAPAVKTEPAAKTKRATNMEPVAQTAPIGPGEPATPPPDEAKSKAHAGTSTTSKTIVFKAPPLKKAAGGEAKAPAPGTRSDYVVHAARDNRAWVRATSDSTIIPVTVGTKLPDGSRVQIIDDDRQVVFTTAGDIR